MNPEILKALIELTVNNLLEQHFEKTYEESDTPEQFMSLVTKLAINEFVKLLQPKQLEFLVDSSATATFEINN